MKKIPLLGTLLLMATIGFAQNANTAFGLKAGVNIANVHDKANSGTDARTGFHFGGLAHIHLDRQFALQPELVYSAQGAKYGGATTKLNYINIPVLLQYMFGYGFRLETGPQIGFLTTGKTKVGGTDTDIKDQLKKTDLSWAFGVGYLSPANVGIDLRYNLGLSAVNKSGSDVMNRVWQIGLFYQFPH